jgi:hypothetical protein
MDMATDTMSSSTTKSSPLILALAWVAVGLPLAWGIAQTIMKALALFR